MQADDLEQLCATIAGDRRNPHLRDDLVQTLVDALAIALRHLLGRLVLDLTGARHFVERGVGQIRVDHRGAVADQAGEVVWIACGRGLDDDVAVAAQTFLYQPVVDGSDRHQCMNRQTSALDRTVRQHDHHLAAPHRRHGLLAHRLQRCLESERRVIVEVDDLLRIGRIALADCVERAELGFRQYR